MKIIYDISPVGNRPEARTGLARTAWSTAIALRRELGNNISFSACGSIAASLQAEELFLHHPELPSAMNSVTHLARQVHMLEAKLIQWQKREAIRHFQPQVDACIRATTNALRVLNLVREPISNNRLKHADIFHSSYARIPHQVRKRLPNRHILTVHDLIPLILPETYFAPGQRAITQRIIGSIAPVDWVITMSESTRRDLCERSPIDPDRVFTVYSAAEPEIFFPATQPEHIEVVRHKYGLPGGDYLLTLHSLAPHKNLGHLVRSFCHLVMQERIEGLSLVVVGSQGHTNSNIRNSLQVADGELKRVHFTGYVPDEDLAPLYSGALGFVFPSLYEGFGLPILEAMQCGCPVISSNRGSLPEVICDAGLLVDPTDMDSLCDAMLKFCIDTQLRVQYSTRSMERAKNFSWQKTASQTLSVYNRVMAYS